MVISQTDIKHFSNLENSTKLTKNHTIQQWFAQAEKQYPEIPKGFLAGFAYTTTNWNHLAPINNNPHNEITFLGIMGLIADNKVGFRNTFNEVAKHYSLSTKEMLNNPQLEIMATADFVSSLMQKAGLKNANLEDMQVIAEYLSGLTIPASDKFNDIHSFAMNSLFYDILLINQKGHDDNGIKISAKPINMQEAFSAKVLGRQQATFVALDISQQKVSVGNYALEFTSQTIKANNNKATVDYPSAIWKRSPNQSSRGSNAITHVSIHRMEGYYASSIALFQRSSANASAHYMVRSSDGQITQMVREYRKAWHTKYNNTYTIGIEHEGFSRNTSKLTTAMYTSSTNIVKSICARRNINCAKTYNGPGNPLHRKDVKPKSLYTVKGHAHYAGGTHWDPGPHWDWRRYYNLINGSQSSTTILDSFEGSEGHFDTKPSLSGSTRGISAWSTAQRTNQVKKNGSYSQQIKLIDNPNSSVDWQVRFLSASGRVSSNQRMRVSGGNVGFWVMTGASGLEVAVGIDDSDGTERSDRIALTPGQWTFVKWKLDDANQWNTWVGGNGQLDATQVTLDAIWFYRNQTAWNVYVYIDDVQYFR
jgi:N-acetyl-anhydromuramyl-L-alanine amidase AmpD